MAPFAPAANRYPNWLLHGAATLLNFVANLQALSDAIPGADAAVIPQPTHGLPDEKPGDSSAAVIDFLRGL